MAHFAYFACWSDVESQQIADMFDAIQAPIQAIQTPKAVKEEIPIVQKKKMPVKKHNPAKLRIQDLFKPTAKPVLKRAEEMKRGRTYKLPYDISSSEDEGVATELEDNVEPMLPSTSNGFQVAICKHCGK